MYEYICIHIQVKNITVSYWTPVWTDSDNTQFTEHLCAVLDPVLGTGDAKKASPSR